MKNKTKFIGFVIAFFLVFTLSTAKAQCYSVDNSLNCSMNVLIQFYDSNMSVCSQYIMTVGSGNTSPINCSYCSTWSFISATIISIGGTSISPIPKVFDSNGSTSSIAIPSPCGGGTGTLSFTSGGGPGLGVFLAI